MAENSEAPTPLRDSIAIIGGGIGGVALAIGLRYRGIQAHVFEAGDDFTELGAGIGLGPNAISALKSLDPAAADVFESLVTKNAFISEEATWFNFRDGMGEPSLIAKLETTDDKRTGMSSLHRSKFLYRLAALIPRDTVHFGKRLTSVENADSAGVRLLFEDGSHVMAGTVVGCDGVRSSVRQYVLDLQHPLDKVTYMKGYAYRRLVPMDTAIKELGEELASNSQQYLGTGGYVLTYPIDGGSTLNVVAFRNDEEDVWKHPNWMLKDRGDAIRAEFAGWGEPVNKIVEMVAQLQPDQWALFNHEHASTYHKGAVVLLGDAAHAMTPHQGAGAGQALEDAAVLAALLGRAIATGKASTKAFEVYDAVRRPRTQRVVSTSKAAGYANTMTGPTGTDKQLLGQEILGRMGWIWEHDLVKEVDDALGLLDDQ